jgi:hypothetical protein
MMAIKNLPAKNVEKSKGFKLLKRSFGILGPKETTLLLPLYKIAQEIGIQESEALRIKRGRTTSSFFMAISPPRL